MAYRSLTSQTGITTTRTACRAKQARLLGSFLLQDSTAGRKGAGRNAASCRIALLRVSPLLFPHANTAGLDELMSHGSEYVAMAGLFQVLVSQRLGHHILKYRACKPKKLVQQGDSVGTVGEGQMLQQNSAVYCRASVPTPRALPPRAS